MSRIDNLIAKHCPGGVRWYTLEDACTSISAGGDLPPNYAKGQRRPNQEFRYPIYSNGTEDKALYGYSDNYRTEGPAVTISARGTIGYHTIRYGKFTPIVRLIVLIPNKLLITPDFLNYALDVTEIGHSGGSIPQLTVPNVKRLRIPVPPMEVQHEIVRILDTFSELEAELKAELEARRKQYAYYRDALLIFDKWGEYILSDLAIFSHSRVAATELDETTYVGVDNLLQDRRGRTDSMHVPMSGRLTEYRTGDILLGNIRPYLKKIWLAEYDGGCNGDVLPIRIRPEFSNKIRPDFLYQVLATDRFFQYNSQHARGGKMPRGDKKAIMRFPVPLPPIELQDRISAILRKFDALVNDLSIGLPAELKARRQQYEYYRDKLLTFEELKP